MTAEFKPDPSCRRNCLLSCAGAADLTQAAQQFGIFSQGLNEAMRDAILGCNHPQVIAVMRDVTVAAFRQRALEDKNN